MRFASITLGAFALVLLVMVPVGGAPSLSTGSQADYKLSASITFPIPRCEISPSADLQTVMSVCPMIVPDIPPTIDINGTLGWSVSSKNATRVNLNVTKDLAVSLDGTAAPSFHIARSFNESIDLATRVSTILPFVMPEVDQALTMAQSNAATGMAGVDFASSMSMIEPPIFSRPHLYTMWWVNGPLKLNESIPVLFLHTNVTGSKTIDLGGSLGKRDAWTLFFGLPHASPIEQSMRVGASMIPISESFGANFTFNYDQKSDLLLSAGVDIQAGFVEPTSYQPAACTAGTSCSSITIIRSCGFNIHVSLVLTDTNLDLSNRLGFTDSGGSSQTPGSNPVTGPGSGTGSGPDSGSNSRTGQSQDANPSSSTGAGSNSGNAPQSTSPTPSTGMARWIYWILGIIIVAVISSALWIARRRMRKTQSQMVPAAP